jgi:hypothetical protein
MIEDQVYEVIKNGPLSGLTGPQVTDLMPGVHTDARIYIAIRRLQADGLVRSHKVPAVRKGAPMKVLYRVCGSSPPRPVTDRQAVPHGAVAATHSASYKKSGAEAPLLTWIKPGRSVWPCRPAVKRPDLRRPAS